MADEDPTSLPARLNLAALLVLAGEPDLAAPHIEFALASGETAVAPYLLALADSLLAAQHGSLASDVYQMVASDNTDNPELLSRMALAALDAGDEKKAQELFARYDKIMNARKAPAKPA